MEAFVLGQLLDELGQ
ncbi:hypothetical protein F383_27576 [Gossypium arboreum]|uniref:Uncharacterized protein n=1 Tax=Gossypium arboreum TaxID=29729 RepID=A0A0B0P9M2_GOSAR|nr:hypothetical protein F383_27576 [Gossypium arboreum]